LCVRSAPGVGGGDVLQICSGVAEGDEVVQVGIGRGPHAHELADDFALVRSILDLVELARSAGSDVRSQAEGGTYDEDGFNDVELSGAPPSADGEQHEPTQYERDCNAQEKFV
jgi:hypothetical protein